MSFETSGADFAAFFHPSLSYEQKAKADNRYFTTMRQKDALASENAVLTKLAEKQQRAVEGGADLQHSLGVQLVRPLHLFSHVSELSTDLLRCQSAAEKEITMHQHSIRAHQDHINNLKHETTELNLRNEQHTKHIAEVRTWRFLFSARRSSLTIFSRAAQHPSWPTHRSSRDGAGRSQEARGAILEAGAGAQSGQGGGHDLELEHGWWIIHCGGSTAQGVQRGSLRMSLSLDQFLAAWTDIVLFPIPRCLRWSFPFRPASTPNQKMLKCSTCMLRFKGVIINRCGHLFCKECIDARLSNRQRKCPSCGMAFGRDDVSNVYF